MIVFNVISPLFKGEPEIKVKNLGTDEAGSYCMNIDLARKCVHQDANEGGGFFSCLMSQVINSRIDF